MVLELFFFPDWAHEYHRLERAGRTNVGFSRWQKVLAGHVMGINPERLDWKGEVFLTDVAWGSTPEEKEEIDFLAKAMYGIPKNQAGRIADDHCESNVYSDMQNHMLHMKARMAQLGKVYLQEMHYRMETKDMNVFAFAEVFPRGHALRPHVHTGALVAGTYFPRGEWNNTLQLGLLDTRGINPPFGKTKLAT